MTDSGGMFSRLLDPNTAKPKVGVQDPEKIAVVTPIKNPAVHQRKSQTTSPLPSQNKFTKELVKKEKKRKVGAYFSKSERQNLDDVEYKLNRGERVIGQSEILALGVETLGRILDAHQTRFSSIEKIREYIDTLLIKAKST
jgi:hypothetical protein